MGVSFIDRLSALPSAQFNRLVLDLHVAPGVLSAESAPQLQRAVELVRYFEQPGYDPSVLERMLEHFGSRQRSPRFVDFYRVRLAAKFARWGPGILAPTASPRCIEAPFDEMYQPLRLRRRPTGDAPNDVGQDNHVVLDAAKLLLEPRHLAIAGAPGSGKTTWMRATYRALIGRDDALPLFITLRDLARLWTKAPREDRSFDVFLKALVAEHVPESDPGGLAVALSGDAGIRPVLLIDGWDELGPLGGEVHEKLLGFLARYPRVLAVVTSRPFGVSIPSTLDGFTALEIQPLAKEEIKDLAQRFFLFSTPDSDEKKAQELASFLKSLEHAHAALELARVPLLLIMMLVVSRSRPLPEKRHLLYQACIESLLAAIPDEKEEQGALLTRPQYRPDDAEERIRLTAALAARTASIVYSFEEMEALLPPDWPAVASSRQTRRGMRTGFLQWLAATAGLLIIHVDDTVVFAHRSLQEFLTAWHWNATYQGGGALVGEFLSRTPNRQSWEMLRLWAALTAEPNRERITPVITALLAQDGGSRILGGLLLADGLGPESAVNAWLPWFVDNVAQEWTEDWLACLDSWKGCPQESRLVRLAVALQSRSKRASLPEWLRVTFACLRLGVPVITPQNESLAGAAVHWLHATPDTPRAIAAGRVFCGTFPVWPNDPPEIGLLQLWPNPRRLFGTRLQLAILCGAGRDDVQRLARARWPGFVQAPPPDLGRLRSLIEKCAVWDWALNIDDPQLAALADRWVTEIFRALSAELQIDGVYEYLEGWIMQQGRDWLRHFGTFDYGAPVENGRIQALPRHQVPPHIPHANDRISALSWMQSLVRGGRRAYHEALARLWGERTPASWLRDFVDLDLGAIDRYGALPVVAVREREAPPVGLLARACRLVMAPAADLFAFEGAGLEVDDDLFVPHALEVSTAFEEALKKFDGDPMWPALARHLCNCATADDQKLLTDLATAPDREPPLSWGLRYIVRGDLMFADGTELTLDQLADDLGLARLPILEPLSESPGALDKKTAILTKAMISARRKMPKQAYAFNDGFLWPVDSEK